MAHRVGPYPATYTQTCLRDEVRETAQLRNPAARQIIREIQEIATIIQTQHLQDPLSLRVEQWTIMSLLFYQGSETYPRPREVLERIIPLLQEIFVDSLYRVPLQEDAALGSDGMMYNPRSLQLFSESGAQIARRMREPFYPERSPFHQNDPSPLVLTPHPLIPHLFRWIQGQQRPLPDGIALRQRNFERTYQNTFPPQREAPSQRRQAPSERVAALRVERERSRVERAAQRQAEMHVLFAEADATCQRELTATDSQQEASRTFFAEQNQRLSNLEREQEEFNTQMQRDHEDLQQRINSLNQRIQTLDEQIDNLEEGTNDLEKNNLQLEREIAKTDKMIAEAQSGCFAGLLLGIIISAAGCYGLTQLAQAGLVAAGSSATAAVYPTVGGFGVGIRTPLPNFFL